MKILLTILIPFILYFTLNAQNLVNIDLTRAKFEATNADKIFKDFKIVSLETHEDAFLKKNCTFYLTDKYIIAVELFQGAYLFDRKTGAFIREVSSFGQGPDQYTGYIFPKCGFDEKNNTLFVGTSVSTGKLWKCINIETNKIESTIKTPVPKNSNGVSPAYAPWLIKNNTYVSFCNNRTGKDKIRLIVYNKAGTIIKTYPNYLQYEKENLNNFPSNNGIFYYYNSSTYFKEWHYNDTVFRVDEKSMTPHLIFKLGNKQPSYKLQENVNNKQGKYLIDFVCESNLFVLYNFIYFAKEANPQPLRRGVSCTGYYDKRSKQSYLSSTPDIKKTGYVITGIPVRFVPISINSKKEMIAQIDPEEIIKYRDQLSPKYKSLFKDIQEDDNPIVIIATLK